MKPNIKKYISSIEVADKIAEEIHSLVANKKSEGKKTFIAISGGSTPKSLFNVLAEEYSEKINWEDVHFFWVDERCVPPEDQDSNYGMTKKFLFDKIEIPEENIHRVRGESIPEKEAVRYSAEIDEFLKFKNGFPEFDLILLGLGTDGHTASIFPDQIKLFDSENVCSVVVHPRTEQKRITLTGKVLNNALHVIFMITGEDKSKVVADILKKKAGFGKYPSALVDPTDGIYEWYVDSKAANLL